MILGRNVSGTGVGLVFDPNRLVALRRERGLSQNGLARRAGVSVGWVQKAEQGALGRPSLDYLTRIAAALAVSVETLTGEPDETEAPSMGVTDEAAIERFTQILARRMPDDEARSVAQQLLALDGNRLQVLQHFLDVLVHPGTKATPRRPRPEPGDQAGDPDDQAATGT